MLALDGAYKSFIYEMPVQTEAAVVFIEAEPGFIVNPSFRWGMPKACLDCKVFHFQPELIPKTETKQISFDHITKKEGGPISMWITLALVL